jgi:hypothetical protein
VKQSTIYCAILADIRDSKKMELSQRRAVQETLQGKLEAFNRIYQEKLAVPLDFSGGDQIQALFYSPVDAYHFACNLREALYPVCFRIGFGLGDWSVQINDGGTNAQDGTSYHRAATAYAKAHAKKKGFVFFSGGASDAILNVLIDKEDELFHHQTDVQKEIARRYFEANPIQAKLKKDTFGIDAVFFRKGPQKRIAEQMQKSVQNISQQMKRGRVYEQHDLKAAVSLLLEQQFLEEGRRQT